MVSFVVGGLSAAVQNGTRQSESLVGQGERPLFPNIGSSEAQEKDTKVTAETITTVQTIVSDPGELNNLSCQNLQYIINDLTREIEKWITRTETCCVDGERYYIYHYTSKVPYELIDTYLNIYHIKSCEDKGYSIQEPIPPWMDEIRIETSHVDTKKTTITQTSTSTTTLR